MTVEAYQLMICQTGLEMEMLSAMNIGDVIDFVYEWIDMHKADETGHRKAGQADFDAF